MTDITVTASKRVGNIQIHLPTDAGTSIRAAVQIVLNSAETYVTETIASEVQVFRNYDEITPEAQAAIDTLVEAALIWDAEDNPQVRL